VLFTILPDSSDLSLALHTRWKSPWLTRWKWPQGNHKPVHRWPVWQWASVLFVRTCRIHGYTLNASEHDN